MQEAGKITCFPLKALASQLDEVFGDRIVIMGSVDGHSTWFSSRALREAGVDAVFEDPQPGVSFFERDPLTNQPLGTAREGAGGFIRAQFIPGDKAAYRDRLMAWLPRAAAAGLTSVYDATASAPTEEDAYQILKVWMRRVRSVFECSVRCFKAMHLV